MESRKVDTFLEAENNRRIQCARGSQNCEIVRRIIAKFRELRNLKRDQAAEKDANNQAENKFGTHGIQNGSRSRTLQEIPFEFNS
jgi:hypothetical protein